MATIVSMLLLALPLCITSQSGFGRPWSSVSALDDFYGAGRYGSDRYGAGRHGLDSGFLGSGYDEEYEDHYDDYFGQLSRAACIPYQAMQLSDWQVANTGHRSEISFQVALPGVSHRDMEAWPSEDEDAIHVRGLRALPARGSVCLPAEAKVSANGQYEILEADIPVPTIGDAKRASVRRVPGGLLINVPPRAQPQARPAHRYGAKFAERGLRNLNEPQRSTHTANLDAGRHSTDSARLAQPAPQAPYQRPTAPSAGGSIANTAAMSRASSRSNNVVPASHKHAPVATPVPTAALPSSDGIEVEDAEFPWPEKDADASEGWFDNRGDFQYY